MQMGSEERKMPEAPMCSNHRSCKEKLILMVLRLITIFLTIHRIFRGY